MSVDWMCNRWQICRKYAKCWHVLPEISKFTPYILYIEGIEDANIPDTEIPVAKDQEYQTTAPAP